MDKRQLARFPELPRYITVSQAARILGISKTAMFHRIHIKKQFPHVYRLGGSESIAAEDSADTADNGADNNDQVILLLVKEEVEKVKRHEDYEKAYKSPEQLLNEWHKRVKQWGTDQNWGQAPIAVKGRPPVKLIRDYLRAHPNDPRPQLDPA